MTRNHNSGLRARHMNKITVFTSNVHSWFSYSASHMLVIAASHNHNRTIHLP